jgi:carboxyl-terminal processing protease
LLDGFRLQNVECVLLDLRNTNFGWLVETIGVAGLFLDTGRVLQMKDKDGNVQQVDDKEAGGLWDGPLVVLVNKLTAGDGEVFAGAIKDHCRGLVVGDESTGGRATSQAVLPVQDGKQMGSMKIVNVCFYRPNGEGFQQRGVRSDIMLPSLMNKVFAEEQGQKGSLAFDRIPKAGFQPFGRENEAKVTKLRKQSDARVKKSEDFQKVVRASELYEERKRVGKVSLVEAEFAKQWNTGRDDSDNNSEKPRNGIVRDYYLDEVMNIGADFVKEVRGK